jgi:hypothetical protein
MTMRRLTVPALQLIFEWDDDGQGFAWAQATRNVQERRAAYECVRSVSESAEGLGVAWQDDELTERYRPVCGMTVMALVWRGQVLSAGGAQALADVIMAGLDVQGAE